MICLMREHVYGQRPPEIGEAAFGLGWLAGVRRIVYHAARASHWHRHPEYALMFCLRGECAYEFRDRPPISLTAGSRLAFPRGLDHRHAQAIDPVGIRLELLINPERATRGRYGVCSAATVRESIRRIFAPPLAARPCPRPVLAAVRSLDALAALGESRLDAVGAARARLLASTILLGCSHDVAPPPGLGDRLVKMDDITAWMEAHLGERIDIDRLVAHVGYSRTHVFTLFRQHTGLTPNDYLTRLRIRRARDLLMSTALPSKDIAAVCGFSSPTVFNAIFRRTTGVTPIAWRTTHRSAPGVSSPPSPGTAR